MINTALLKEQLKRFWGLSALLFICYVLTIALPIYVERRHRTGIGHLSSIISFINMDNPFIILSMLIAPLIAVIVLFQFQNQSKSTTAMHSYPTTRNQLLVTNALAAMILLVLPLLALCAIMFFSIHQSYHALFISPIATTVPIYTVNPQFGALANSIFVMSSFFFITALSFLFYLSVYTFAATLSGNSIITLLLCAALPFLPIGLHMLATAICQFYVFGFYPRANPMDFLVYMHPFLFSFNRGRDGFMLLQMISYSAIIIAMAACCIFATNKREQERAGDSVVFPYVKNALVFILSVCGLLLLGFIFYETFWSTTAMYIGFVIGFFIAYCIAQMIAEKTFNILSKIKDFIKFGAIAVSILLLIIVSTGSDIFGYERRIPHFADIEGIQMQDVHFLFFERDNLSNTTLNELLVKDQEIINETMALHQAILNERAALRQYQSGRRRGSGANVYNFNVLYKLNNGNVIVRSYPLPLSFMTENDVNGLMARSRLSISLFQNRPDLIYSIDIDPHRFYSIDGVLISRQEHILGFINALEKDHDLLTQPNTFYMNSLPIRIILEPEDLGFSFRWIDSLFFEIVHDGHRSYVRDWLIENGYY